MQAVPDPLSLAKKKMLRYSNNIPTQREKISCQMISDLLQRILMNSANLYAVCCLLLWGGLIVFAVVVLCMKAPEKCGPKEKFPVGSVFLAVLVSLSLYGILLIGNPVYLPRALLMITLLFCVVGAVRGSFRLLRYGIAVALLGTVGLYSFFHLVCRNGFDPEGSSGRLRRIVAFSAVKAAAEDRNVYPAGILDECHPVVIAHPDLLEQWKFCGPSRRLWHSAWTRFYEKTPLPPFHFRAGTIEENKEALRQHIFSSGDLGDNRKRK